MLGFLVLYCRGIVGIIFFIGRGFLGIELLHRSVICNVSVGECSSLCRTISLFLGITGERIVLARSSNRIGRKKVNTTSDNTAQHAFRVPWVSYHLNWSHKRATLRPQHV